MHQDDGLEGGSTLVGQLMERFLFAPALVQQGVTDHAGRAFEARAEVEGDVRAWLGAAAARQVDLKPAERVHNRGWITNRAKWAAAPGLPSTLHMSKRFGNLINCKCNSSTIINKGRSLCRGPVSRYSSKKCYYFCWTKIKKQKSFLKELKGSVNL